MIIDDSDTDQYLSTHIIKKYDSNIEILQAYDGEEALEILKALPIQPDLIFLDINMPRMNGHEFLEEYDKWEKRSEVIIMLTSSDQEQDKKKSLAYQCVKKYYVKPIEIMDLKTIIQEA
jgi:CheY-like chemotaxis protein